MHVQSSLSLWLILIRQTLNWLTTVSFFCLSTSKTINLGEFDNCYSRVLNALKMIFFPELISLSKNESLSMSEFCPTLLASLFCSPLLPSIVFLEWWLLVLHSTNCIPSFSWFSRPKSWIILVMTVWTPACFKVELEELVVLDKIQTWKEIHF